VDIAYIAFGANLPSHAGQPAETLAAAVEAMAALGTVVACSTFYQTEPVGYRDQPVFTNGVVALATELAPEALLHELLRLERAFGRDRSAGIQNGPRALDLDLLLHGNHVVHTAHLQLPHPRFAERLFVLEPLAEIAPALIHPGSTQTVAQLLQALRP
jgi:2-amino-4-hydroxy-6-hydroxymethyldihydropteridine diphosphokinase